MEAEHRARFNHWSDAFQPIPETPLKPVTGDR